MTAPNLHRAWPTLAIVFVLLALYGAYVGQTEAEIAATRWIQDTTPAPLHTLADFMTFVGHSPVYPLTALVACAALLAARRPSLALMLLAATALRASSVLFKDLVDRPRPSPAFIDVATRIDNPSFPSGHVLGATLLYGFLVYAVEIAVPINWIKRTLQAGLIAMIGLMGFARVELGEHWPTDVIGGWAVGILILLALFRIHQRIEGTPVPGSALAGQPAE